jgi:hypothetical protein
MNAGKKQNGGLGFQVFTEDELYEIHLATLDVLEHTGLFFEDEEALEVLDGGGVVIDKKKGLPNFLHLWLKTPFVRRLQKSCWPVAIPSTTSSWKVTAWGLPISEKVCS